MEGDTCKPIQIWDAFLYASEKHKGQTDKAGVDYIWHPVRVASGVSGTDAKIVALLHDTVEDTDATAEEIESLFGPRVANAVEHMTHRDGEDYFDYIRRLKEDPLAVLVKLSDLHQNMDLGRLPNVTDKDRRRVEKYKKAEAILYE